MDITKIYKCEYNDIDKCFNYLTNRFELFNNLDNINHIKMLYEVDNYICFYVIDNEYINHSNYDYYKQWYAHIDLIIFKQQIRKEKIKRLI